MADCATEANLAAALETQILRVTLPSGGMPVAGFGLMTAVIGPLIVRP